MEVKALNDYGKEQLEELKKSWLNNKITRTEYEHEILIMHQEGIIQINQEEHI